jgi:L-ribulose-5-phosphate 4-epimerase
MNYKNAQEHLFEVVLKGTDENLIRMSAGNFSLRTEDGLVAITPSGIDYLDMSPSDISIIDLNGKLIKGLKASSEMPMHTAIYRNLPEVGGICHTHSTFAITFAMLGESVPMVNIELMVCGAPIPVAPWASPGTEKAGENTVEIFKNRPELKVALLRKHGLIAIGANVDQAFGKAFNAEVGFQSYFQARQFGSPEPLTEEQLTEIKAVYQI